MATEKWIGGSGQGLTYGNAFGTEVNSLANGNSILSSVSIANGTPLDIFANVSASFGSITAGSGAPFIGLFLYPLNEDGTTYGDGRFATTAAGQPPTLYAQQPFPCIAGNTGTVVGTVSRIILPPGTFSFVLWNNSGVALASSGNAIKYRTYNRQVS